MRKTADKELLSTLKGLTIRNSVPTEDGWLVEAEGASSAICPGCGMASHSRHSCYWRTVRDLPLQGRSRYCQTPAWAMALSPPRLRKKDLYGTGYGCIATICAAHGPFERRSPYGGPCLGRSSR